jgi:putative peptidoglycan lipid II flippase
MRIPVSPDSRNPSGSAVENVIIQSGSIILSLSVITLLLGLLVQVGLAAMLGTGREMDAYLVAIGLPTFLTVVSLNVCNSALVPLFKAQLHLPDSEIPRNTSRNIFMEFCLLSLLLVLAVFFLAGPIVRAMAPGLDEPTFQLAAGLLRIMILGSFFDIQRGFLTAFFYARERFFAPQVVPILNHAILLLGLVFLFRPAGLPGIAWAWTFGSLAMFLPLLVPFLRETGVGKPPRGLTAGVWSVLLPTLIVVILQQTTPLLDRLAASLLPSGSISSLGYAGKIPEILMRTIPMAVGLASFPLLSQQALERDISALRSLSMFAIRSIILFSIPLAFFLFSMRLPLTVLLFQRGQFDASASQSVSEILKWYAVAFIPGSILYPLANVGFALRRPWKIAGLSFLGACGTLFLNLALVRILGPEGVAVSYLITTSALAAIFILWLAGEMHTSPLLPEPAWIMKILGASGLCLIVWLGIGFLIPAGESDAWNQAARLLLACAAGIVVYISTLWVWGLPEIRGIGETIGRRLPGL